MIKRIWTLLIWTLDKYRIRLLNWGVPSMDIRLPFFGPPQINLGLRFEKYFQDGVGDVFSPIVPGVQLFFLKKNGGCYNIIWQPSNGRTIDVWRLDHFIFLIFQSRTCTWSWGPRIDSCAGLRLALLGNRQPWICLTGSLMSRHARDTIRPWLKRLARHRWSSRTFPSTTTSPWTILPKGSISESPDLPTPDGSRDPWRISHHLPLHVVELSSGNYLHRHLPGRIVVQRPRVHDTTCPLGNWWKGSWCQDESSIRFKYRQCWNMVKLIHRHGNLANKMWI